jgi:multidrug efflux system membrane fusion protein
MLSDTLDARAVRASYDSTSPRLRVPSACRRRVADMNEPRCAVNRESRRVDYRLASPREVNSAQFMDRSQWRGRLGAIGVLSGLLGVLISGCQKPAPPPVKPPPPTVFFTTPVEEHVQEFEEFTGRTAAISEVSVRARVSGYLDKVAFEDGAMVKQGDVLFHIDDRTFQAELAKAEAVLEQAKTRLARFEKEAARAAGLFQSKVISEEAYDSSVFNRDEAVAAVNVAIAERDFAKLNVEYSKVLSPIDGRISRKLVDEGNLVKADDTMLAVIVQDRPIHAYFDIDERTVLRLRRLVQEGKIKATRESRLEVGISLADEREHRRTGVVDFEDNHIDPTTGTLRVRLLIDNEDHLLSPGLFVRLRFPIGEPRAALLVPEESLGSDQGRRYVFVIGEGNVVSTRPVDIGILVGGRRVIEKGLSLSERVVVTGLQRLKKNAAVDPRPLEAVSDSGSNTGSGTAAGSQLPSSTGNSPSSATAGK